MNQITHIMSEIARLRIENAELKRTFLIRKMQPAEPEIQKAKVEAMFSDEMGFELYAGPDYGMNSRAEKAGFMSMEPVSQKKLHKFYSPPIGIGNRFFG